MTAPALISQLMPPDADRLFPNDIDKRGRIIFSILANRYPNDVHHAYLMQRAGICRALDGVMVDACVYFWIGRINQKLAQQRMDARKTDPSAPGWRVEEDYGGRYRLVRRA